MAKKTRRCVFVDDKEWVQIQAAAKKEGRSASNWIQRALSLALAERR